MMHRKSWFVLYEPDLPDPAALAQLERSNGGRLAVAILNTASGERAAYRANERFAMCSKFKFLLVAAILKRVDGRTETLDRNIAIPPEPLLYNSPLTALHAGGTMTIADLCRSYHPKR
jgi:beta-lactamase class A